MDKGVFFVPSPSSFGSTATGKCERCGAFLQEKSAPILVDGIIKECVVTACPGGCDTPTAAPNRARCLWDTD